MKQTYTYEVNGFQIHAEYEEKDIETIFIPLLQKWKEMQYEVCKLYPDASMEEPSR